jgi:hypothetical protein
VLLEIPGSISDDLNMKAAQLVNEKGLNTQLFEKLMVESGGTDLFVAGKNLLLPNVQKLVYNHGTRAKKSALEYSKNHKEHKLDGFL